MLTGLWYMSVNTINVEKITIHSSTLTESKSVCISCGILTRFNNH